MLPTGRDERMHKKNTSANIDIKQILLDCVFLLLAYLLSGFIYTEIKKIPIMQSHFWIYILFTVIFVLCMFIQRMYNITTFYYIDRIVRRSVGSAVISGLCITVVIFLSKQGGVSRLFYLLFCVLGMSFIIVTRMLIRWTLREHIGNGYTHVLFIGDSDIRDQYLQYTEKTTMKIKIDKHISYDSPVLQDRQSFEEMLKLVRINEVIFVYLARDTGINIKSLMNTCEDMGITVRLVLDLFDLPNSNKFVSSVGTYPVLTYHNVSFDKVSLFIKRVIDVVGATCGLLLLSPLVLFVAIAIRLESSGPVFFVQTRIGQNGKPFKMHKFRSMYRDAEERKKELMVQNKIKGAFMFKLDEDPRITKVGAFLRKTSIDELPQLFDVLTGDMSLVGTRPPLPDEVAKYDRGHWRRISIKPGITGMWQVNGRSNIVDFEEIVALDKQYIDEWSLALDIKLLCKTVSAVLSRKGAS